MSNISSIFAVFPIIVGILLFAIWSNTHVYAQHSSPPTPSASPKPSSPGVSGSLSTTTTISPEFKAKMCDPSNPKLKVVNTTESRICGIPVTVKPSPPASSAATSQTSPLSSSTTHQTTTTKPTAAVASVAAPPKQQQIATTNNNNGTKAVSRTTGVATHITLAPSSNSGNRSISSPSAYTIAPQVKAVNQLQQQPPIIGINNITEINGTTGQNYTFAAASPAALTSDKLMYLGYHGDSSSSSDTPTNHHSISKGKDGNSDNKPSTHHDSTTSISHSNSKGKKTIRTDSTNDDNTSKGKSSSSTNSETSSHHARSNTDTDNGSTGKKTTSSTAKSDDSHNSNGNSGSEGNDIHNTKSSSHTNDGSKSSSDLASAIRNKVDSIIKNSIGAIGGNFFG
jgi:hypothetical protein